MAVIADFIALIPTITKTLKNPHSETPSAWFILMFAAALSALATTKYDIPNLLYPAYSALSGALIAGIAYFGQKSKKLIL